MPNRKYQARFPPARIKKIMRTDKEVGKVAASVPVVISRALELFAEELIRQAGIVTISRGSRTLSPAHLKQCVFGVRRFDFLHDVVAAVADVDALTGEHVPRVVPPCRPQSPVESNGTREVKTESNGETGVRNGEREVDSDRSLVINPEPPGAADPAAPVCGLGFYQPIASATSSSASPCPASSRSLPPASSTSGVSPSFSLHYPALPGSLGGNRQQ